MIEEKKSRTSQYSAKGTVRVRKDLIKKENRYTDDESFSSDSSSESDENTNNAKSRTLRKSKRSYTTSSSDFDMGRSERVTRTRGKIRRASVAKDSYRKEPRYKDDTQSMSRSSSTSSYASQKEKRVSSRRRESQRNVSDDDSTSTIRDISRKERELLPKTIVTSQSSSDSEEDRYRSHSQCSNYSNKSYTRKKKSKHKDRHKSKKKKRSSSRTYNSSMRSRLTRRHPV